MPGLRTFAVVPQFFVFLHGTVLKHSKNFTFSSLSVKLLEYNLFTGKTFQIKYLFMYPFFTVQSRQVIFGVTTEIYRSANLLIDMNYIIGTIQRHFGKQMNKETKFRIHNITAKAALKFGSES
jgi:hypothetical protein